MTSSRVRSNSCRSSGTRSTKGSRSWSVRNSVLTDSNRSGGLRVKGPGSSLPRLQGTSEEQLRKAGAGHSRPPFVQPHLGSCRHRFPLQPTLSLRLFVHTSLHSSRPRRVRVQPCIRRRLLAQCTLCRHLVLWVIAHGRHQMRRPDRCRRSVRVRPWSHLVRPPAPPLHPHLVVLLVLVPHLVLLLLVPHPVLLLLVPHLVVLLLITHLVVLLVLVTHLVVAPQLQPPPHQDRFPTARQQGLARATMCKPTRSEVKHRLGQQRPTAAQPRPWAESAGLRLKQSQLRRRHRLVRRQPRPRQCMDQGPPRSRQWQQQKLPLQLSAPCAPLLLQQLLPQLRRRLRWWPRSLARGFPLLRQAVSERLVTPPRVLQQPFRLTRRVAQLSRTLAPAAPRVGPPPPPLALKPTTTRHQHHKCAASGPAQPPRRHGPP